MRWDRAGAVIGAQMTTLTEVPIFPLKTVLFPGGPLPLRIFEPRYVAMVSRCLRDRRPFMVSAIKSGDETTTHRFEEIGTLAEIVDFETLPDGLLGIVARGGDRVHILRHVRQADGLYVGELEPMQPEPSVDLPDGYAGMAVLLHELMDQLPEYYRDLPKKFGDATWVGYRYAEILALSPAQKQEFLEMEDAMARLEVLRPVLEALHPDAEL